MKQLVALFLTLIIVLLTVGCATRSTETETYEPTSVVETRPEMDATDTGQTSTEDGPEGPVESSTEAESETSQTTEDDLTFRDETGSVRVIATAMAIRSTPSFSEDNVIGYASSGNAFPMTGRSLQFCRILYEGETAYISASSKYVEILLHGESETESETESATETATESATEIETDTETESSVWGQTEYAPERWQNSVVNTSRTEYTYDEMEEDLRLLAERYPTHFTYTSIGTSLDGRSIYAATLGAADAPDQLVVTAGIHAREYVSCLLVMAQAEFYLDNYNVGFRSGERFADQFAKCAVVIVPMVNPDGVTLAQKGIASVRNAEVKKKLLAAYESDRSIGLTASSSSQDGYFRTWKSNLAGVDLNRNFNTPDWDAYQKMLRPSMQNYKGDTPESEPETQALIQLMNGLKHPVASLCMHSQGEVIYWNCGQTGALYEVNRGFAELAVATTGYRFIAEENHDASFSDWCVMRLGLPAITVEIGNGRGSSLLTDEQIPKILEENRFLWTATISYFCK